MAQGAGRILLVEDNEAVSTILSASLELDGYDVTASTSSVTALALFERDSQHFDLVITDYTMPEMSGADLIGAMRRLCPDIPIILCSGSSAELDAGHIEALGLNAYLPKPVGGKELHEAIQHVFEKRAAPTPSKPPA